MTRTPNQTGSAIESDAVGCPVPVTQGDVAQDIGDGASASIHAELVDVWIDCGQILCDEAVTQRSLAGITIGSVIVMDGIGQSPAIFEAPKSVQQLFHVIDQTGREQPARADQ